MLDRGRLQQCRQRKPLSERLLDAMHQPRCQKRMSTKLEEIVANSNRSLIENRFPDPGQLCLKFVGGRYIFLRLGEI